MGGSLFGNIYVFVAWRGKDDVSESEQTTLAILLAAVSFSGVLMLLFKTDFQITTYKNFRATDPPIIRSVEFVSPVFRPY